MGLPAPVPASSLSSEDECPPMRSEKPQKGTSEKPFVAPVICEESSTQQVTTKQSKFL